MKIKVNNVAGYENEKFIQIKVHEDQIKFK